jgi:hypothetical protein
MGKEEFAIARELLILEPDAMRIIVSVESKLKAVEFEAFPLLGVAFGLLDLAYHSIIHWSAPFRGENKKARAVAHAFDF